MLPGVPVSAMPTALRPAQPRGIAGVAVSGPPRARPEASARRAAARALTAASEVGVVSRAWSVSCQTATWRAPASRPLLLAAATRASALLSSHAASAERALPSVASSAAVFRLTA